MTYLEVFVLLQILDFLTTVVGLRLGGSEMSPFIAWMMRLSDPMVGLAAAKAVGFTLAGICVFLQKPGVIHKVNYFFAALVIWNLVQIMKGVGAV